MQCTGKTVMSLTYTQPQCPTIESWIWQECHKALINICCKSNRVNNTTEISLHYKARWHKALDQIYDRDVTKLLVEGARLMPQYDQHVIKLTAGAWHEWMLCTTRNCDWNLIRLVAKTLQLRRRTRTFINYLCSIWDDRNITWMAAARTTAPAVFRMTYD